MNKTNTRKRLKLFLPEKDDVMLWKDTMELLTTGDLKYTINDEKELAGYLESFDSRIEQDVAMRMIIMYSVDNYIELNRAKLVGENEKQTK